MHSELYKIVLDLKKPEIPNQETAQRFVMEPDQEPQEQSASTTDRNGDADAGGQYTGPRNHIVS